jgi:cyclopropane fatty-acyl-phospholipid synthase-like methyltransferase
MEKPYYPATARNREPILKVLRDEFADTSRVLEIGSGSGQHAVFFAAAMPHLRWQASDRRENLPGILAWVDEAALDNLPAPVELDVGAGDWPPGRFDGVYTANTCHIMSWPEVEIMFARVAGLLEEGGVFCVYGPFNAGGRFTSQGNADFHSSLRAQAPHRGLRDIDDLDALARRCAMTLARDHEMPANNRLLVFLKPA